MPEIDRDKRFMHIIIIIIIINHKIFLLVIFSCCVNVYVWDVTAYLKVNDFE